MTQNSSPDSVAQAAADLLNRYGFDLGAFNAEQLVGFWLRSYPAMWIRSAVVEALYQGRYKSVSVGQILAIWKRRGQPIYHYSFEFERMVCGTLSRIPTAEVPPPDSTRSATEPDSQPDACEPTDVASITESSALDHRSEEGSESNGTQPAGSQELTWNRHVSQDPEEGTGTNGTAPELDKDEPMADLGDRPSSQDPTFDFVFLSSEQWWERHQATEHSIHQFTPDLDPTSVDSRFYEKLRAVAHYGEN